MNDNSHYCGLIQPDSVSYSHDSEETMDKLATFALEIQNAYPGYWSDAILSEQLPSMLPGGYTAAEYSQEVGYFELSFAASS
jgi:hypothetical protein